MPFARFHQCVVIRLVHKVRGSSYSIVLSATMVGVVVMVVVVEEEEEEGELQGIGSKLRE